jgi:hypothetical protein
MNVDGKDVRIGINAQGRKSTNDCLSWSNQYRPLLRMILSEYEKMPNNCRAVSEAFFCLTDLTVVVSMDFLA